MTMNKSIRSVDLCPFDDLPCEYVSSCDDVLILRFGVVLGESTCSRAVFKTSKK